MFPYNLKLLFINRTFRYVKKVELTELLKDNGNNPKKTLNPNPKPLT